MLRGALVGACEGGYKLIAPIPPEVHHFKRSLPVYLFVVLTISHRNSRI